MIAAPGVTRTRAVVVTDLDGTIAFGNRPPGPATTAVLEEVAEHPELRLVLASSRPPPAIRRLVGSLADRADLVACNGALRVTRAGEVSRTSLHEGLVLDLLTALAGDAFCLDFGDWFAASTPGALRWMGSVGRGLLHQVGRLNGVLKVATADDASIERIHRIVTGRGELIRHETGGRLEVVARGVNKATGLTRLLGTDRPPVIAFGNDHNDVELLQAADRAVVVGDGLPSMTAHPHLRRVTDTDGVVAAAIDGALADLTSPTVTQRRSRRRPTASREPRG